MTIADRVVIVRRLPGTLNAKQRRIFLREVQDSMTADRPRVVLDCSNLRGWDNSVAYLLFCCLEEAMKRNGDVKLAGLPVGAGAVLKGSDIGGLFDVYPTAAEAVNSFHQLPAATVAGVSTAARPHREPESLA